MLKQMDVAWFAGLFEGEGSLAAYARMCKLRLDPHAQKETQQIAEMVSDIIKPLFPISWSTLIE